MTRTPVGEGSPLPTGWISTRCQVRVTFASMRRQNRCVDERKLVLDLTQMGGRAVARGDLQLDAGGPLDRHVGVVVGDAALDRLVVVGRALVHDVRRVGDDEEAVREPNRAIELVEVLLVEAERLPLAERRRAAPQV